MNSEIIPLLVITIILAVIAGVTDWIDTKGLK